MCAFYILIHKNTIKFSDKICICYKLYEIYKKQENYFSVEKVSFNIYSKLYCYV